jgi:BRCT domain type II-containing protein
MLFDGREINDTSSSSDTAPDGTAWRPLMQRKPQASSRFVAASEVHFTDPTGHGAVAQHLHGSPRYHPRASGVAIVPCNLSSFALKSFDCFGVKQADMFVHCPQTSPATLCSPGTV